MTYTAPKQQLVNAQCGPEGQVRLKVPAFTLEFPPNFDHTGVAQLEEHIARTVEMAMRAWLADEILRKLKITVLTADPTLHVDIEDFEGKPVRRMPSDEADRLLESMAAAAKAVAEKAAGHERG